MQLLEGRLANIGCRMHELKIISWDIIYFIKIKIYCWDKMCQIVLQVLLKFGNQKRLKLRHDLEDSCIRKFRFRGSSHYNLQCKSWYEHLMHHGNRFPARLIFQSISMTFKDCLASFLHWRRDKAGIFWTWSWRLAFFNASFCNWLSLTAYITLL